MERCRFDVRTSKKEDLNRNLAFKGRSKVINNRVATQDIQGPLARSLNLSPSDGAEGYDVTTCGETLADVDVKVGA